MNFVCVLLHTHTHSFTPSIVVVSLYAFYSFYPPIRRFVLFTYGKAAMRYTCKSFIFSTIEKMRQQMQQIHNSNVNNNVMMRRRPHASASKKQRDSTSSLIFGALSNFGYSLFLWFYSVYNCILYVVRRHYKSVCGRFTYTFPL